MDEDYDVIIFSDLLNGQITIVDNTAGHRPRDRPDRMHPLGLAVR